MNIIKQIIEELTDIRNEIDRLQSINDLLRQENNELQDYNDELIEKLINKTK